MNSALHPLLAETVLTLAEAATSLPPIGGREISVKSLYAWKTRGVRVGSGRVKLEACRMGGRWVTSREALGRFMAATSGEESTSPVIQTPKKRQRASDEAMAFVIGKLEQIKGSPRKEKKTARHNAEPKAA